MRGSFGSRNWNEYNLNPLTRNNWRASLVNKTVPADARLPNRVMVNHCEVSGTGKTSLKTIPWEVLVETSRNARQDAGVFTLQVRANPACKGMIVARLDWNSSSNTGLDAGSGCELRLLVGYYQ
jgi:hypothetical protein